ncbi:MAG: preprotein translocase subunit SecE [Candidatus Wildermuthbacteria bacterium RIFCSPHIGHO2_01_FULL_49_22b]|uniref:Protein translocase subunit SecE n=1 Tax=Candidatus Wildermuthbacteria bacterium RIFCSPHIGHO2_01_FULL_49_22b TaxID=1802448 RepID=A0A1G2QYQ6_9BACT|nr:MAG: preprotein translocase subunit SecE [Candidatus Wildermuthbacteria bacterium RIFCSPHIGHO2_01_FULL_49_22b]
MALNNPFSKAGTFLKESRGEAKKVDWPTRQKTLQNTIVVIVFSVAVAIFLSAFDLLFGSLLERFIL